MYNFLYDGKKHTDTSTLYLKNLGMNEESIESLQRDKQEYEKNQYQLFIKKRNQILSDSDWIFLRHNDQLDLNMSTTLSDSSFLATQKWRQQLRDMTETYNDKEYKSNERLIWPPIPLDLEKNFPDYPPDIPLKRKLRS